VGRREEAGTRAWLAYRALSLLLVVGYFAPAPPRLAGSADKAEAARP